MTATKRHSAIKDDLFAAEHRREKIDRLGDPLVEIEAHIDFGRWPRGLGCLPSTARSSASWRLTVNGLTSYASLQWKRAPAHTSIRYALQGLDPNAVEAAFRHHAGELDGERSQRTGIAIDGKILRASSLSDLSSATPAFTKMRAEFAVISLYAHCYALSCST